MRAMLTARAFSNGADKVASDLLLGFYSSLEIAAAVGMDESNFVEVEDQDASVVED